MRKPPIARIVVCASLLSAASAQHIELRPVRTVLFPMETDSNSPAFWKDGKLVLYNSTGLGPVRIAGVDQKHLVEKHKVVLDRSNHRPYWIEAAFVDEGGAVLAWYHHEPPGICAGSNLTAPQIGALVSHDGGKTFNDLGIVLESGDPPDCSSQNGYFAGGNGDFTVIPGRNRAYLYFLFSNYGGPVESQGVAVARMPYSRRFNPIGAVEKFYDGAWSESGIGGRVTPIFPAAAAWQLPEADSFWGPSVHWNTHLNKFVMLLNRSCCTPFWPQEGVYASFNDSLANPAGWTPPVKIMDGGWWYPQVLGRAPTGTDKLAGQVARLYVYGVSHWEIIFHKEPPGEPADQTPEGVPTSFRSSRHSIEPGSAAAFRRSRSAR